MQVTKKGRYWAFVGYPESLPSNYIDILTKTGLPVAISPIHDKDFDPTEEEKKSHYHFILCFDGPTTYQNVKTITDSLNSSFPIKLESIKGMYRYHIHQDNPDKFQYSNSERTHLNGFDINLATELTKYEVQELKKNILQFIREKNIVEYSTLLDYLFDSDLQNMFDVASNHTIFFNTYITSRRNNQPQLTNSTSNKPSKK